MSSGGIGINTVRKTKSNDIASIKNQSLQNQWGARWGLRDGPQCEAACCATLALERSLKTKRNECLLFKRRVWRYVVKQQRREEVE
jgi:hypothetical protein